MSVTPSPSRVREVLDLALERPGHERAAFIAGVCAGDSRLRAEVESLLSALDAGGDLLEPPAGATPPAAEPLTGLRFGNYRVGERMGAGGMGVVYRAEDMRLGRPVAVKALPPTLARDAHRRARFEHEARVLASLNHPNIAAIHGVEETARGPVLVLEYVPGETLARRLERGSVPIDEAISMASAMARGLEAAHAAGVVHRDLKPSNIQITPEGGVKILDFGVAKQAQQPESAGGGHTLSGQLIGTAGYMSPEQARGKPVDRRADLWAFGCVLYEMLTGVRAFEGETSSDTVAAVLRAEPDWLRLPAETPASVVRLLRRCLEKDPDRRQRDAGDACLELEGSGEAPLAAKNRRRRPVVVALAVMAAIIAGAWVGSMVKRSGRLAPRPPVRFEVNTGSAAPVYVTTGGALAISPDGGTLVYSGGSIDRSRLYSRRLDSHDTVELPGTENAATPCISPDGKWVAFCSQNQLKRVPATGGGPEVLATSNVSVSGLAWGAQGVLFISMTPMALCRVGPQGDTKQLTVFDSADDLWVAHPEPLPGGRDVLVTAVGRTDGRGWMRVEAVRLGTGARQVVVADAAGARFFPPDRLVFWQAGALMTAPIDLDTLRLTDVPTQAVRPIAGGERMPPTRYAVSPAGVLATLPGNIQHDLTRLAWYEPDGAWTEVTQGESIDCPRISPDGTRIAVLIGRASGDVWVHDIARGSKMRLTDDDRYGYPVWTLDSRKLVVVHALTGASYHFEQITADGSGSVETLWEVPAGWAYPTDFTREGNLILSHESPGSQMDIYEFDMQKRGPPRRLLPPGKRFGARMSPDGSMIAYTSEETGSMEVYLHRYPSMDQKICVSVNGGYRPTWSGDGRKLFFRYVNRAMVVDVENTGEGFKLSPVRLVSDQLSDARYDVDREGKRLLMGRPAGDLGPQTRIDVVVGWDPGTK